MQIDDPMDADSQFPWPTPGMRSMTDDEFAALSARLQAAVQRACGANKSTRHTPRRPAPLQQ